MKKNRLVTMIMLAAIVTVSVAATLLKNSPVPETWAAPLTGNYLRITTNAAMEIGYRGKTNVGIGTNRFTGYTGILTAIERGGATQAVALHVVNGWIVGTNTAGQ